MRAFVPRFMDLLLVLLSAEFGFRIVYGVQMCACDVCGIEFSVKDCAIVISCLVIVGGFRFLRSFRFRLVYCFFCLVYLDGVSGTVLFVVSI